RYTWGDAERVSQEAPVILLRADKREQRLGGAANVCNMLCGLGARATLAGVVGDDADGDQVRDELRRSEVGCASVLTDADRPTTVKERFMGRAQHRHPHQILRVDNEVRDPLSEAMQAKLVAAIEHLLPQQDIVLISDYAKGVCTPQLLAQVIRLAHEAGKRVLVDPIRGNDYSRYRGASAMTPNRMEAGLATDGKIHTAADALPVARKLYSDLELEAAIITLDKEGMALVHSDGHEQVFPTRQRQVYDITGAGDMVLAVIGICLAAGAGYDDAIRLANVAGGLEVEKVGCAIVTRDEILADLGGKHPCAEGKILDRASLAREVSRRRDAGQRIVFTNGCFDILHAGHARYLQDARAHGDCLIVAINSDSSVCQVKGPTRPIIPQADRASMLAALEVVEFVTIFDEQTPHALLHLLRPDVLIKGGTYTHDQVVGWEVVEAYGGQVVVGSEVKGLSTTAIVERIRAAEESGGAGERGSGGDGVRGRAADHEAEWRDAA
ncbi:MAG: D-glycero-beta-D-manno-heptose 1-phosphate adenylyltransferase, partial [Planctomycetes bacterium]|nr:D-glycero-beta-D-manno-heptose 1-phosphate adenylyltransferase [Planctomycetota bacterium]